MIEDKELGLKIAESAEESTWEIVRRNTEKRITETEVQLEIDRHVLKFAKLKLERNFKK